MTLEKIKQARTNHKLASEIYRKIFYDGSQPKLRMFLVKSGIPYHELDDVESHMNEIYSIAFARYSHEQITFEKYVWSIFIREISYWFTTKGLKKHSFNTSLDEFISANGDIFEGVQPDEDMDIENIIFQLSQVQGMICRLHLYNGWTKREVCNFLRLDFVSYDTQVKDIRQYLIQ